MTDQEVQLFLADLAIIILLARLLGMAAKRLGQPPVLGEIIADAVEGKDNPLLDKFRWRPEVRAGTGTDAARSKAEL